MGASRRTRTGRTGRRSVVPRRDLTMVTTFQSGHGWTAGNNSATNTNLNDTSDYCLGSQSAKVESLGTGEGTTLGKVGMSSIDMTGKHFVLWAKVDDLAHLSNIQMYVGDTNFTNYWLLSCTQLSNNPNYQSGEWVQIAFGWNLASTTGSPSRSAITDIRVRFQDDNTATKVVVHFNGLAYATDPSVFPHGVVSFTFDDSLVNTYTNARRVLDKYGMGATSYTICDLVGSNDSTYMTLAQLKALEDYSGWEVAAHAFTSAHHDARFNTLTTSALDTDFYQMQAWLDRYGFRGGDHLAYPGGIWGTDVNSSVADVARQYFQTARALGWTPKQKLPPEMPHRIASVGMIAANSVATLEGYIDNAYTNADWLIFTLHGVVTSGATGSSVLDTTLDTLAAYLLAKPMPVRPVGDVMRALVQA